MPPEVTETTTTTETTTSATHDASAADGVTREDATQPTEQPEGDTPGQDAGSDDDSTVLGGKAPEDKPDGEDQDEASVGAPEEYDLSLKDEEGNDVSLDEELLGTAKDMFREANLSNEQANALLALGPKIIAKGHEAAIQQVMDAGAQQRKAWLDEFTSDPEIGGANREETEHLAAKGLDALGFDTQHPFRVLLTETGLGNNVHMIRAMRKVGELVGEDGTFAHPSSVGEESKVGWSDRYKD